MYQRLCIGIGKILACALSVLMLAQGSHAKAATLLSPAPAFYDRVVRLEHASRPEDRQWLVATAVAPAGGMHANVYLADRDGAPFRQIGEITDPAFGSGLCCGTLYELPQQVGSLRAGTLLWAAAVGKKTERMAARIYRSDDEGRSWSFFSEIRAANPGGIWEPEFTVGSDGALILFFSDETDPAAHSQTIKKVRTYNGLNWRDMGYVVASNFRQDRPGMPVARLLSDGRWMMTYELCGPAHCMARYRLSNDGWNWGNFADVGVEIRLSNGAFPAHAPTFTVMPDGAVLLVAQLIETPELKLGARNGRVLLVNSAGNPATPWRTVPAPVPVLDACSETCRPHKYNWCPNYSSALLPSEDGTQVLEFASDWTGKECITSYAWARWRSDTRSAAE